MKSLTKNSLGTGSSDDDFSTHRGNPNLNTWITILGQLSGQNFVQFSEKNSVCYELQHKSNQIKNNQQRWIRIQLTNLGTNFSLFAHLCCHDCETEGNCNPQGKRGTNENYRKNPSVWWVLKNVKSGIYMRLWDGLINPTVTVVLGNLRMVWYYDITLTYD